MAICKVCGGWCAKPGELCPRCKRALKRLNGYVVEAKKYEALVEKYHELRENFIDYYCSGIPNVAPYCLNRCEECVDGYGWCNQSDKCQGFNPTEVILDEERRTDNA